MRRIYHGLGARKGIFCFEVTACMRAIQILAAGGEPERRQNCQRRRIVVKAVSTFLLSFHLLKHSTSPFGLGR